METKRKTKPKPIPLGVPIAIPSPREPTPNTRPEGELDALAANFQYLSDRVSDVAVRGDLPANAHEFITKTQQAVNNLATYTRKVKDRDLKEYRQSLADHRIALVLKVSGVAVITVFLSVLFNSSNNAQPNQTGIPPTMYAPNTGSAGLQSP